MKLSRAIELAHGREKLADLLVVKAITTYKWGLDAPLPDTQEKRLRHMRPRWFKDEPPVTSTALDVEPRPADEPSS